MLSARWVLLVFLAACSRTPERVRTYEDWFSIKINGAKSGYMRVVRRTDAGSIRTETHNETRLKRLGTELAIVQDSAYEETADGKPLRFVEKRLMSKQETVATGEIKDGKLTLVTNTGGSETKREIAWKPEWLFPAAQERLLGQKASPGAAFSFDSYSTEFGKAIQTTVKGVAREKVLGVDTVKSESSIDAMKGIVSTEWRDADGRLVKSTVSMMGLEFVTERCDAGAAVLNEKGEVPEVFTGTLLRPKQAFGDARKMTEALYRITLKEGEPDAKAFTFEGQTVEKVEGRSMWVRVRPPTPSAAVTLPVGDAALKPCLQPNDFLQCDDAKVAAMAREAAGGETDGWKAAKKIEAFVHAKIKKKNFGTAFATAKEVCENLEGDCTEHSVLAAALARAIGLPSRVAIGLASAGGAWGGHMWTEVWVGRWVPIDATFGGEFVDASHIKMGESSLNETGVGSEFVNVLLYLGRMELDVVEVEAGGRRFKPD